MASRPTREEMMKKIGTREPLPGGPKQQGPNFKARPPAKAASEAGKGVNFLNPKAVNAKRAKEAGMKCGGKVKKK